MYEYIYMTETGYSGTVKFYAESIEDADAKAYAWDPTATFEFVGLWASSQ